MPPPRLPPNVISCPDCNGLVSKRAIKCPHCGGPIPKATSFAAKVAAVVCVAFLAFIITPIAIQNTQQALEDGAAAPPETSDQGQEAYYIARRHVEKHLKAPATAKWSTPGIDEGTGWGKKDGAWIVAGHVDSQNSFGAMIRTTWDATLIQRRGKWIMQYVRIGDESVDYTKPQQ